MSNYHIVAMAPKEHKVNVVFHIPIPNENNSANVNLRTALAQYISDAGKTESAVPWDIGSEEAQILAGEIYEHRETVDVDAKLTVAQKRDLVDARYTALSTQVVNKVRSILKFWGMDRNV